jgi:hypothetical protein
VFSDESARSIRSSGRATPHSETIQLVENAPLTGEALLCKVTLPLFNFINVERICSSSIALAVSFFSRREDFPRSSLGPGWLELPIVDCRLWIADFRLLMDIGRSCHTTFSIVSRQSAIGKVGNF